VASVADIITPNPTDCELIKNFKHEFGSSLVGTACNELVRRFPHVQQFIDTKAWWGLPHLSRNSYGSYTALSAQQLYAVLLSVRTLLCRLI
jgi:hypothetical protein